MTPSIDSMTTQLLSLALDASSLRHQAIAHNLANTGTEGFHPVAVSFEDQLTRLKRELETGHPVQTTLLQGVRPVLQQTAQASEGVASPQELDELTVQLAGNTMHYQALLKGLNKHMSLMSIAINEGKR